MSAKKGHIPSNVERAMKIFAEHGDFIRSVIDFNVRNKALSEDLFQDLFLFFVSKPIPEEVQCVRGFLYKVITDGIKDTLRRIDRYQTRVHRYAEHQKFIIENCPENSIIEAEEIGRMFELIERRLPLSEARALTLRYKNSCDTAEVAKIMGIKSRSVSRYISIGLRKVRYILNLNRGSNYDRS